MRKFVLVFLFCFIGFNNLEAKQITKEGAVQQLKNTVTKYCDMEKYKDYKGMSELVFLRYNITTPSMNGTHTFKNSREYFLSIYDSDIMAPLDDYKIIDIDIDSSLSTATVKIGRSLKRGFFEGTTVDMLRWIYYDSSWFVDISPQPEK